MRCIIKKKNNSLVVILLLLVAFISVGYAAISSNLQINGSAIINKQTWDVHFNNVQVSEGSVATTDEDKATIKADENGETTLVTYKVTLAEPGDFYEFTVDVENKGTLDAKLNAITMTELTEEEAKVISYTAEYVDSSDATVSKNDVLAADATNKVKVKVMYRTDIDAATLNAVSEDGISLDLSYGLEYIQNK